jgi:hypothetical protein
MSNVDLSYEYYDRPAGIVESQIGAMSARADTALAGALATMDALAGVEVPAERGAPWLALPAIDVPGAATQNNPVRPDLEIGDWQTPELGDPNAFLSELDALDSPPTFVPSVGAFQVPEPPAFRDFGDAPEAPEAPGIELPALPDLTEPSMETLDSIEIPVFEFPLLPVFEVEAPEWPEEVKPPNGKFNVELPSYKDTVEGLVNNSVTLEKVLERVSAMLEGGTGIPAVVEQALFDRARGREEIGGRKAVEEAFGEFAARGFSLPPGALAARVQEAREAATLAASAINRDILVESAKWEIDNLRFAVQQGIALESLLMSQFNVMADRALKIAETQFQATFTVFNAFLALFNARQSAYEIQARVYEIQMRGALAELETQKAQLETLRIRGDLNEQRVKIFTARWQAVAQRVEAYKAQMQGAQAHSDLYRGQVEAYRARVQAWGEQIQADKLRFDAYDSRMKGEQAKAGVLEAESRAFAATVQAYEAGNNLKVQRIQTRLAALDAMVRKFNVEVQAKQSKHQAKLGQIQAATQLYQADITQFSALVQADTSDREIQVRHAEATLRNHLAHYEILVREYDARMTRLVEEVKIQAQAIQAAGQMASQLAAGAMSAMHVQASLSGSGSKSSSSSRSESHNYNYDMTG